MDLFTLVAKLTLDKKEYERDLDEVEKQAEKISDIDATLSLDDRDFVEKIEDANEAEVDNPDKPELDLDDEDFTEGIDDANEAEVDDPDEPELDLDDSDFVEGIDDANEAEVDDPDTPNLDLETKDFKQALDDSQTKAEEFKTAIETIFEHAGMVLATTGVTLAVRGLFNTFSEITDLAMTLGDDIDKSSQRLNISTDAYQEWGYVLKMNGANINDFNRGILTMNEYLTANGDISDDAEAAFARLGITAKKDIGQIRTTEDALYETIKALAEFEGTDEQRGVFATAIFGKNANVFNALFNSGIDSINALMDEAHKLGLVMTSEEVANAAAYNDAFTNWQESLSSFKTSLVSDILPALTNVMNTAAKIVAFFNWRTGDTPLSKQFEDIDNGAVDVLADIDETQGVAMELADKLIAMGNATQLTADQQEVWIGTAERLIDLVPSLSDVIDTDTLSINGNAQAIRDNITEWSNLAKERALQAVKEEKFAAIAGKTESYYRAQVDAIEKQAKAEYERQKAVSALNAELERMQLAPLSSDATEADMLHAQWQLYNLNPYDNAYIGRIAEITDDYVKAQEEAEKAEEKAEGLYGEVEEGTKDYEAFVETLNSIFESTSENADGAITEVDALNEAVQGVEGDHDINFRINTYGSIPYGYGYDYGPRRYGNAKGLNYVPYDNYPADLHRGEMVLTSTQAREYREERNYNSGMDMSALIAGITSAVHAGMQGATVKSYLSGKDVTDNVNRETIKQLKARRFAT